MTIHPQEQLEPLLAGRRPVRAYGPGRACAFPGCGTQLSLYNANERCWAHVRAPISEPSDQPHRSKSTN